MYPVSSLQKDVLVVDEFEILQLVIFPLSGKYKFINL